MKRYMIQNMALLVACVASVSPTANAEVPMIRLGGTPQQIGRTWGELNRKAIAHDMNTHYLEKAATIGIVAVSGSLVASKAQAAEKAILESP